MQITNAESSSIDIRLNEALPTASGTVGDRGGLRVRLEIDGAKEGIGETAPIPGIDGPGLESIAAEINSWCAVAIGDSVDAAIAGLSASDVSPSPLARFAIHTALIDAKSRDAGLPLSQMLRAGAGTLVRVNALVSEANPGAVHARVLQLVADGMYAIKLKVGAVETAQDVTRIIAASEAAGPNVALRLDANRSWDAETAERVIGRVGMHRIDYLEDPTPNVSEYHSVEVATGVAVALDLPLTADPMGEIERANTSIVVIKPAAIGGVDRVMDLSRLMPDLDLVISSSIDREVALSAAIHTAAALPRSNRPHGLATGTIVRNMPASLIPTNGVLEVSAEPGVWTNQEQT
jgi:o-succinylbenzoate synthase